MKTVIADQIERITYFEELLDEASKALDSNAQDNKKLREIIDELEGYYTSEEWKKDFADDESGKLPADLKRGVLSEDGISNVLDRFKELACGNGLASGNELTDNSELAGGKEHADGNGLAGGNELAANNEHSGNSGLAANNALSNGEQKSAKKPRSAKKPLAVFYGVTLALSFILEIIAVKLQSEGLIMLLMWIPGVVGIICAKIFYPKQKAIGFFVKFKFRYFIYAILIPFVYLLGSYLIGWAVVKDPTIGLVDLSSLINGGTVNLEAALITLSIYFFVGIPISAITAMGEELGWRGFAYPLLEQEFGRVKAVLINGGVWALWHLPLIIGGIYQAEVNVVYGLIAFILCIMVISVIFCWSRSVSGSVIPAILLHAVHNHLDQSFLQPLSTKENLPYFAGEQGFVTILVGAVLAYLIFLSWRKSSAKKTVVTKMP